MKSIDMLYPFWAHVNQWDKRKQTHYTNLLNSSSNLPFISVVVPVYNTKKSLLKVCIASFRNQIYHNKELILVDDGSTSKETQEVLKSVETEKNIRVVHLLDNSGIAHATNVGIEKAQGDFVAFLDHDDMLSPEALLEVGLVCEDYDVIYTDESKITDSHAVFHPQFKQNWNPELLLSYMYVGHLLVVRRSTLHEVGLLRKEFDGAQDYDLMLRLSEVTSKIHHIPKILYYWRATETSTALGGGRKPDSIEKGRKAVEDALKRRGIKGNVIQSEWATRMQAGFYSIMFPDEGPKATIVIVSHSNAKGLGMCLQSITKNTSYKNYEIVLCLDRPISIDISEYITKLPYRKISHHYRGFFNSSSILNKTITQIDSEYIVIMHDDVEVKDPLWLSSLIGYAQTENVGVVGGRILDPQGRIQNVGYIHGYYDGGVGSPFVTLPSGSPTYQAQERIARAVTGVDSTCMLIRKSVWEEIGGFSELFHNVHHDIDFCIRANKKGFRSVFTPQCTLIHYKKTGTQDSDTFDDLHYRRLYREFKDPWHNPNISLMYPMFEIEARCILTHTIHNIRVLSLAYNLNLEGSSLLQYYILTELKKRGIIDPCVYCYKDGPLRKWYENEGIEVLLLTSPLAQGYTLKSYTELFPSFQQLVVQTGAEVVHSNTLQMFYGIDVAKSLNLPSVWSVHEGGLIDNYYDHFDKGLAQRAQSCLEFPYQVIFVCYDTCRKALKYNRKNNFQVIHTNIPERTYEYIPRSKKGIGFLCVGTLCKRKNQLSLIKRLTEIPEELWGTFYITLVGDSTGEYGKEVLQTFSTLPEYIQKHVEIVGVTTEVWKYYKAHDVLLLPSLEESYPLVILEALQHGLGVIAYNVNGVSESVLDRITGRLIPAYDERKFISEMIHLIVNPDVISNYKVNGNLFYEGMISYNDMIERYSTIFQEAYISGKSR